MPYIRNPGAYAAAIRRNQKSSGRKPYKGKRKTAVKSVSAVRRISVRRPPNKKPFSGFRRVAAKAFKNAVIPASVAAGGYLANMITGRGDYMESKHPLNMGQGVPQFATAKATSQAGVRVCHREYIQDVQGSTGFVIQNFSINPGQYLTFPWLSSLAANFEQFKIHGMVFVYKATCATAVSSTNTALGTVIMATQYNSLASPFTSKQQMENYQYAVSGVPFNDMIHPIECERGQTTIENLYVRTGAVPSGQDGRLYDLGLFSIATVGMQAQATIGELWISFDVELLKPRIVTGVGGPLALTDHFQLPTTISSSHYLGPDTSTVVTPVATSNLGGTCINSTYYFPQSVLEGQYLFLYSVTGASTTLTTAMSIAAVAGSGSGSSNLTQLSLWDLDTHNTMRVANGAVATSQIIAAAFKFNGGNVYGNSTVQYSAGTLPGTITSADLFVCEMGPQLLTMLGAKTAPSVQELQQELALLKRQQALQASDHDRINLLDDTLAIDRNAGAPDVDPPDEFDELEPEEEKEVRLLLAKLRAGKESKKQEEPPTPQKKSQSTK